MYFSLEICGTVTAREHFVTYNRPLDESGAKVIFKQVVEAVAAMHDRGIYHRDLKMNNWMYLPNTN